MMMNDDGCNEIFEHTKNKVRSGDYRLEWNEQGSYAILYRKDEELLKISASNYFALSDLIMIMDIAEPNLMTTRTVVGLDNILVQTKKG